MEYSDSIHKGKTSNLLRAECVGKSLTLYVNGLVVKQVEDSDFSAGDVGLTAAAFNLAGTDIRFDNFQASTP